MTTSKTTKEGLVLQRPAGKKAASRSSKSTPTAQAQPSTSSPPQPTPALKARADQPERIPAGLPKIYADLAMDVVYGLHTTKIVLGEETGGSTVRPVAVAVIPTGTLLIFAKAVVRDLSSPGMITETAERFANILSTMQNSKVE